MLLDFKQLDEIEFIKLVNSAKRAQNSIKFNCGREFSEYNVEYYAWIADNEKINEKEIIVEGYDFEFDLNKIKGLARKLRDEELDFILD